MRYILLTLTLWVSFANAAVTVTSASGTYNNAIMLQGRNISATAPTDTHVLTWNATTSAWEGAAAAASGANVTLSNLTAPTAIDEDLIFSTGAAAYLKTANAAATTKDLNLKSGDASVGNSGDIILSSGASTLGISGSMNIQTLGGATGSGNINVIANTPSAANVNSGSVYIAANGASGSGNSGSITLLTGAVADGTSGGILLQIGTETGSGARGDFRFYKNGVASVIGDVWTATGVTGEGYWAAPTGGSSASGVAGLVQYSDGASGFSSNVAFKWVNATEHLAIATGAHTAAEDKAVISLLAGTPGDGDAAGDIAMISMRNGGSDEFGFDLVINNNITGDFLIKRIDNDSASESFRIARADGVITMPAYGAGAATFSSAGVISSASDERLKDIQRQFTTGLTALMSIKPITFKWRADSGMGIDEHEYSGFSAQNVMSVIPEGVGQDARGFYSLQDRALMAVMVNAIKELSAKVTALEKRAVKIAP